MSFVPSRRFLPFPQAEKYLLETLRMQEAAELRAGDVGGGKLAVGLCYRALGAVHEARNDVAEALAHREVEPRRARPTLPGLYLLVVCLDFI